MSTITDINWSYTNCKRLDDANRLSYKIINLGRELNKRLSIIKEGGICIYLSSKDKCIRFKKDWKDGKCFSLGDNPKDIYLEG